HPQAIGCAVQLRKQVEAGQRRSELALERAVHDAFDHRRRGEEPQPKAQGLVVVLGKRRLGIKLPQRRAAHVSSPISTKASPLASAPLPTQKRDTASATSCASTRRGCPASLRIASNACAALSPVFAEIFASEPLTRSVATYPGQTAFTVMPLLRYSTASARVSPTSACFAAT